MERKALIDNDGILFEYRRGMIKRIAQALGKPLTKDFLNHFYETTLAMDDSEVINAFSTPKKNLHHVLNSDSPDSFGADVTLYEKAREGLILLKENGFSAHIVTARTERMREVTIDAFRRHNLLRYIDDVFMRSNKDIPPHEFKGATAAALGVSHAFEDTFHNLVAVVEKCKSLKKAYLINQPWNAKFEEDELYPVNEVFIERMDTFHHAALAAVESVK